MVEHRRHAACIPLLVSGKPCSPSLYHLHLVYLILVGRVPYRRAILQVRSHNGKICIGFGILLQDFRFRCKNPSILLAFFVILSMGFFQYNEDCKSTPRYFVLSWSFQSIVRSGGGAWSCYSQDTTLLREERLVSHSANLLRSSCSASQSDWSLICQYTMQSSAKRLVFEEILSGRLLKKKWKSKGPSNDPWGTLLMTGTLSDELPSNNDSLCTVRQKKGNPTVDIPSYDIMQ